MTETLDDVSARKKPAAVSAEQQAAAELVRLAKEMTEHLVHETHQRAAADNIRNGTRAKTVLTEHSGHVEIDVPRDRAATFEPQIVRKRQRRLPGVDEIVLSLYAKGLTTGEIGGVSGTSLCPGRRAWGCGRGNGGGTSRIRAGLQASRAS
jgi:transposase-like protein